MSHWFSKRTSTSRPQSSHPSNHPLTPPAPLRSTVPLPIAPDMPSLPHHYPSQRPSSRLAGPVPVPSRSMTPIVSPQPVSASSSRRLHGHRHPSQPVQSNQPNQHGPRPSTSNSHRHQPANPEEDYLLWGDGKITHPQPRSLRTEAARRPPSALKSILKPSPSNGPPMIERSTSVPPRHGKDISGSFHAPGIHRPFPHLDPALREGYALHWMLLPFNENQHKAKVHYDISDLPENLLLEDGFGEFRMLSAQDREKSACKTPIHSIVIFHQSFPDWKTCIDRKKKHIRIIDVFDAVHDMFNVCLSTMERTSVYAREVKSAQAKKAFEDRVSLLPAYERDKGMRRIDLLLDRKYFGGLEWIEPCKDYPDGAWTLVLKTKQEIERD